MRTFLEWLKDGFGLLCIFAAIWLLLYADLIWPGLLP